MEREGTPHVEKDVTSVRDVAATSLQTPRGLPCVRQGGEERAPPLKR
jgi:hypothetical protein